MSCELGALGIRGMGIETPDVPAIWLQVTMPGTAASPLQRRSSVRSRMQPNNIPPPLNADIDPSPALSPFVSMLAFLLLFLFIALQFLLPVTHFRHPADPLRTWIPVDQLYADNLDSHNVKPDFQEVMVAVMTKETDIRPVFVAINSTILNTKAVKRLHFVVVVPQSIPSTQTMKLLAVFSDLKIHVYSDTTMIENIKPFLASELADLKTVKLVDLIPFYLPKMFPRFKQFLYLYSDAVLQGDIEELIHIEMQGHPIAAVEDCTQTFGTYFSAGLLEASRLSSGSDKPQMPGDRFELETCLFDTGILVLDRAVWDERKISESVNWWISMQHKTREMLYSTGHLELAVQLALYHGYKKLDSSWSVREPLAFENANDAKLIHFDKYKKPWHRTKPGSFEDVTLLWWKYISPSTNVMFDS